MRLPTIKQVICTECNAIDDVAFGPYGSEQPCTYCDASPVSLIPAKGII